MHALEVRVLSNQWRLHILMRQWIVIRLSIGHLAAPGGIDTPPSISHCARETPEGRGTEGRNTPAACEHTAYSSDQVRGSEQ